MRSGTSSRSFPVCLSLNWTAPWPSAVRTAPPARSRPTRLPRTREARTAGPRARAGKRASVASARPALWAAAVGLSAVALLAGCAAAPISGVAQQLQDTGGQQQQFVEPLPPPGPKVGESGTDVVTGFLHASASFAED